ncbi:MAG: efflux RND transporter periplasmic adaptor subunit [Candidatus Omnitrophica bacterium]|nr:efflux RND transporter periplasmic adaptor subunit [Candidatus Omnitrophota bacterium]
MTQSQEPNLIEEQKIVKIGKKRPWKRITVITLFLMGLAGFGIYKFLLSSYPEAQGKARAGRESFLESRDEGVLKEIYVANTGRVKKDEKLFEFENDDNEMSLLETAQRKDSLEQSLKFREKEKEDAAKKIERARILYENGVIGKGEYEGVQLNQEKILTGYAEMNYEFDQLGEKQQILKKKKESLLIKAPFDGIFLGEAGSKKGNYFNKGEFLGLLFDPSEFYVEALFDEKDVSKVKIGDHARVSFNAFAGVYNGFVSEIDEKAKTIVEKVYKERNIVRLKIKLDNFPDGLKPFMKGRVRIIAQIYKAGDFLNRDSRENPTIKKSGF